MDNKELSFEDLLPQVIEYTPVHPTLGPLPVKLKLRSKMAPEFALKEIENMHIWKRLDKADKKDDYTKVAKDLEQQAIDNAAFAIIGWDNDKLFNGPYSPDNAKKLMADPRFEWLRKGVNLQLSDDTNFFRKPSVPAPGAGDGGSEVTPK